MQVHVGDLVEVDRLGMPWHGYWGVVDQVEGAEAVVLLAALTKVGNHLITHAVPFESWELRVLRRANDTRGGT